MEVNELMIPAIEQVLERMGWKHKGCDQWEDPTTGTTYGVVTAYEIHLQRVEE